MKASELLVLYEAYLSDRFKKYGHYLKAATALLRQYKGGNISSEIKNQVLRSGTTKAYNLGVFLIFIIEERYSHKVIDNDLDQALAKSHDLIEEYHKGEKRAGVYTSPLNQLLKSIENGDIEKFIYRNPKFNQKLALEFLTWINQTNNHGKIGMTPEQIQHRIDELIAVTMDNNKDTVRAEMDSILKALATLQLPYLDAVIIHLIINLRIPVTDLIKLTGNDLQKLLETTGAIEISNYLKHESPLPKRSAFPTLTKKEVEKIVHRAFSALGKPEITLTEWRKLQRAEHMLSN